MIHPYCRPNGRRNQQTRGMFAILIIESEFFEDKFKDNGNLNERKGNIKVQRKASNIAKSNQRRLKNLTNPVHFTRLDTRYQPPN